jgi:hypothetical protein
MEKDYLILKRALASRPSSHDDYDVLADGVVVGRIMKAYAAPVGSPWFWTLGYGYHRARSPTQRLCRDARGCDGSVCQKLAAAAAMKRPAALRPATGRAQLSSAAHRRASGLAMTPLTVGHILGS